MLNIWIEKEKIGLIEKCIESSYDYNFAYYSHVENSRDISLTMPISFESYSWKDGLHPIFQMNLPEGRLRESIEKSFRKRTQGFDDLKLLEIIGSSQIGRLRFSNDPLTLDQVPLQSVDELIAYDGTEDLLRYLLSRFSDVSGISGVQPKVLIKNSDEIKPSEDKARVTVKGATHIVKGWDINEYPHLASNEFFCMKVAQRSGLEVPAITLSKNNQFIIIERFDLTEKGTYLGFEDFCVLNGVGTNQKYEGSYEKIAKRIRDFVSPEMVSESLASFFKSLVVSCALRNGDAHLKNYGVIYETTNSLIKLSPAYDIVTTTAYIKNDSLALTMDGSKRFPKMIKLLNFAKIHCDISSERAKIMINEVAEAISLTLSDLQEHIKLFKDFEKMGAEMMVEWNDGINNVCRPDLKKLTSLPNQKRVKTNCPGI